MRTALGLVALMGFAMSLLFHVSTYFPRVRGAIPVSGSSEHGWIIFTCWFFGLFLIWPLMIIFIGRLKKPLPTILSWCPKRIRVASIICMCYASTNFLVMLGRTWPGSPATDGVRYYLHDHGRKIRNLTEAEYHDLQNVTARGFTAFWMMFYWFPAAFFVFIKPRDRRLNESADSEQPHLPASPGPQL